MSSAMRGLIAMDGLGGPGGRATTADWLSLRVHSYDWMEMILRANLLRVSGAAWAT